VSCALSIFHSLLPCPHHDALSIALHLRMHATGRRVPHFLSKAKGAGEPSESRRNVSVENVGDDLSPDPWFGRTIAVFRREHAQQTWVAEFAACARRSARNVAGSSHSVGRSRRCCWARKGED